MRCIRDEVAAVAAESREIVEEALRLIEVQYEDLPAVHSPADALRPGHMNAAIHFAKARALERLRAFDLAAEHYRSAAKRGDTLRAESQFVAYRPVSAEPSLRD